MPGSPGPATAVPVSVLVVVGLEPEAVVEEPLLHRLMNHCRILVRPVESVVQAPSQTPDVEV